MEEQAHRYYMEQKQAGAGAAMAKQGLGFDGARCGGGVPLPPACCSVLCPPAAVCTCLVHPCSCFPPFLLLQAIATRAAAPWRAADAASARRPAAALHAAQGAPCGMPLGWLSNNAVQAALCRQQVHSALARPPCA